MTPFEFASNVYGWSNEKNMFANSTATAQWYKGISEFGELADAIVKDDADGQIDALGDTAVCAANVAYCCGFSAEQVAVSITCAIHDIKSGPHMDDIDYAMRRLMESLRGQVIKGGESELLFYNLACVACALGHDLLDCMEQAWNEIKDRKGFFSKSGAFIKEAGL